MKPATTAADANKHKVWRKNARRADPDLKNSMPTIACTRAAPSSIALVVSTVSMASLSRGALIFPDHLCKLVFAQNLDPDLLCLGKLGSGLLSCHEKVEFPADP